ncbi:Alpha/Beta hydrolase protein [Schizothecium vesticola]|uniref:Alpha/Beta hydrolase protein n=1 Tax=Schizothecium vesticola TaxID=314040 RepID=A0AA40F7E7_9PEZI|nr:Alpha/Beta hydrolase protein [Schizothecium vesticola]
MTDFSAYDGPSAEWLALEPTLPPMPIGLSLEERRRITNAGREEQAALAMKQLGPWVQTQDFAIPTRDGASIEARTYRHLGLPAEPAPVYVHFHGGGFLFGSLAADDALCSRIAINTHVVVLNVNYRHTPEATYPTAWNDAEDAFQWLHGNAETVGADPQRVIVGGISAGAYLTASLVLQKHLGRFAPALPPIAGQVLMIPCLVNMECYGPQLAKMRDPSVSSWETCKDAPVLPRAVCRMFMDLLQVESPDASDLRMNPGNASAEQVKGLPPTVVGVAGLDPLRDEGLLFAKMLTEARVPTDVSLFPGVPHGFRRFGDKLSECKRWDQVVEGGILWVLAEPEATGEFVVKTE